MCTAFLLPKSFLFWCLGKRTIGLIILPMGLSIAGNSLFAGMATADIGVNKNFNPISVTTNQPSKLSIDLFNSNSVAATGTTFTDSLPPGLKVASPNNFSSTCNGTLTAVPGATSISLANGIIPASAGSIGTCKIEVDVVSTSTGTYLNTILPLTVSSSQGKNPLKSEATLLISSSAPITGSKAFSAVNLHGGGAAATMTIVLNNINAYDLTGTKFTDTFPAGLKLTATPAYTNTCSGTVTANPSTGSVALTGGNIVAGSNCTITVQVEADNANIFQDALITNSIAANSVTTTQGITNSTAIQGTVQVQRAAQVAKSFAPSAIQTGQTSVLTLTLKNFNASAINGANLTDTFPPNLTATGLVSNSCGGSPTVTAGAVTLTGGSIPAAPAGSGFGSCDILVNVTSTQINSYTNSIPAGNFAGVNYPASTATLAVAQASSVSMSKAFSPSSGQRGNQSTLTLTLNNTAASPANITSFTDDLTSMGAGFTVAASPAATTTCGGTVVAVANSTSITKNNGAIPANGSCIITVPIAIAPNAPIGARTNSIPINGLQTDKGNNTTVVSAPLTVQTAVSVSKAFTGTATQGGQVTLTLTLTNAGSTSASITAFTDNLNTMGTGFTIAASPLPMTTCTGGTVTAIPGDTLISQNNGTIPANGTCKITVPVAIAANASVGVKTNTIPIDALQTDKGNNTAISTANTTVQSSITVSKKFASSTGVQGGVSSLTITLANGTTIPAAITSFTDSLTTMGSGFTVAASPAPTTTCGGNINTVVGSTNITKTDGSIPAKGSCTITLPVAIAINATTGSHTNTIPIGNVQTSLGNNEALATTNLTVQTALGITKTYVNSSVPINGISRLTISLNRSANAPPLTGISFTDSLPSGQIVSNSPNIVSTCGGSPTAIAGTSTISLAGGFLAGGASATTCDISVNVRAPGTAGSTTNNIPIGGVVTDQGATNGVAATAKLTTTGQFLTLNKSFFPPNITLGQPSTLTVLILNNNVGAVSLSGAALTDVFPTGMSIATTPNQNLSGAGCTGSITANPGSNQVSLSNGGIPAGAICTLKVDVTSTFAGNLSNSLPVFAVTSNENVTNNNSAAVSLTLLGTSDLQVLSKDDGITTIAPGGTSTYTIKVKNNGPDNVAGATFVDTAPVGMTINSWTCTASTGSACDTAAGTGNINASLSLLNQGTATYTVNVTISLAATGSITNKATISAPPTVSELISTNNSAEDTNTIKGKVSLILVKRITAVGSTTLTTTIDDAGSNDNNPYWPKPIDSSSSISTFLAGDIDKTVLPGDIVEYTIYFLDNGTANAAEVNICDFIPKSSAYLNGSLLLATGSGSPIPISDPVGDTDGGFYPNLSSFPAVCSIGTDKGNGAVVVNVGNVSRSIGAGDPLGSYGFIRFRTRVNQ
jgi:uncharacterized repeat protein (TIGR01451 family)